MSNPCIYPRREGCVVHPDDLELCDSTLWSNPKFFRALKEYHKTVSDVKELYCSRPHLLEELK